MTSPPSNTDIRRWLDDGEFETMFNQLGWDRPAPSEEPIVTDDGTITAELVGIKRGVGAWRVTGAANKPDGIAIARKVRERTRFRLLVCEMADDTQLWLWPDLARSGSGERFIDYEYTPHTQNDHLIQRLQQVEFALEEESDITAPVVIGRLRSAFDKQKLTNSFFKEYKKHQRNLAEAIRGLKGDSDQHWYSSILLNRLMFIYFIQQKGFLNSDRHYLRSLLERSKNEKGKNKFFREVLLPLFHVGLGAPAADTDDKAIRGFLGTIPYVNGDVFSQHELERNNRKLDISDDALQEVLAFLDRYRWHLDERPTGEVNEIRPDVLGFIFEQYVNQKESGAYYTPEDVTHYMSSVTVLPALLDRLATEDVVNERLRELLSEDPGRYIWPAMSHGYYDPDQPSERLQYPEHVRVGLDDITNRSRWSEAATPALGHPRESWREVVHRHRRYEEVREILSTGQLTDELMPVCFSDETPPQSSDNASTPVGRPFIVNDLISLNLDVPTLVDDYLGSLDLDQLQHAWDTLTSLTVLDPTGGSGAFLLAALELLADCYVAIYERALDELHLLRAEGNTPTPPEFIAGADTYANARYFILKGAMLKNLYSLDIMREAGEIARLRMYLKLAAQVDNANDLEPLPDLEFNIRTGNLLVGIASQRDFDKRFSGALFSLQQNSALSRELRKLQNAQAKWRALELKARNPESDSSQYQRERGQLVEARKHLQNTQATATTILNRINWAAREGRDIPKLTTPAVREWVETHQPFHWMCQFPHVFADDGFDVIIGNPPYVKANTIQDYSWHGYRTEDAPDIYAVCLERAIRLLMPSGRISMILPHSISFSQRQTAIRSVCYDNLATIWTSTYDKRPSSLFYGVQVRSSILLGNADLRSAVASTQLYTSMCQRWEASSRLGLFERVHYSRQVPLNDLSQWLRVVHPGHVAALMTIRSRLNSRTIARYTTHSPTDFRLGFKQVAYDWLQVFVDNPPTFDLDGEPRKPAKIGDVHFRTSWSRDLGYLLLSGTWGFSWWMTSGDSFNYTKSVLESTPADLDTVHESSTYERLLDLASHLKRISRNHLAYQTNAGLVVGRYDMGEPEIQEVVRESDDIFARAWGLEAELEELRHAEARHLAPIVPDDER